DAAARLTPRGLHGVRGQDTSARLRSGRAGRRRAPAVRRRLSTGATSFRRASRLRRGSVALRGVPVRAARPPASAHLGPWFRARPRLVSAEARGTPFGGAPWLRGGIPVAACPHSGGARRLRRADELVA